MQHFGKKGVQWLAFSNKCQLFAFSAQPGVSVNVARALSALSGC